MVPTADQSSSTMRASKLAPAVRQVLAQALRAAKQVALRGMAHRVLGTSSAAAAAARLWIPTLEVSGSTRIRARAEVNLARAGLAETLPTRVELVRAVSFHRCLEKARAGPAAQLAVALALPAVFAAPLAAVGGIQDQDKASAGPASRAAVETPEAVQVGREDRDRAARESAIGELRVVVTTPALRDAGPMRLPAFAPADRRAAAAPVLWLLKPG